MKIKLYEEFSNNYQFKTYRGINNTNINYTYGDVNDDGMGEFSTDSLIMAKWFAGLIEYDPDNDEYVDVNNDGKIVELTLTVNNPYIIDMGIDSDDDSVQQYFNEIKKHGSVDNYRNFLVNQNFDCVILKNCTTNYYVEDSVYTVYIVL